MASILSPSRLNEHQSVATPRHQANKYRIDYVLL